MAGEGVWEGVQCCVEVTVRGCEASCSRGEGEWRGDSGEDVRERPRVRGRARKAAFGRACERAFALIFILLSTERPPVAMVSNYPLHQHYIISVSGQSDCRESRRSCEKDCWRPC